MFVEWIANSGINSLVLLAAIIICGGLLLVLLRNRYAKYAQSRQVQISTPSLRILTLTRRSE